MVRFLPEPLCSAEKRCDKGAAKGMKGVKGGEGRFYVAGWCVGGLLEVLINAPTAWLIAWS